VSARLRPGPTPIPAGGQALHRLRRLLTAWFTLVLAIGVVVLVVAVAWVAPSPEYTATSSRTGQDLAVLLGLLGAVAVAGFAPMTWILLGYLLAPATRLLVAQESFLGAAAHDLRTPLATLTTLLDTARNDPQARADALDRAARLVTRSGDTVDDLLLRARLVSGTLPVQLRPARLDQVVEAVLADLAATELDVVTDQDDVSRVTVAVDAHRITLVTTPTVARLDPVLIERAVANLLANALRHGHQPGEAAQILVTVGIVDGRAAVTIADQGPGLRPPVDRPGLGLSVVRWVARGHGGAVLLGAGSDPGTRIRLALPVPEQR
jgi:two-component system, OmpR family, sensor kinase